jgi:hypothetical protein
MLSRKYDVALSIGDGLRPGCIHGEDCLNGVLGVAVKHGASARYAKCLFDEKRRGGGGGAPGCHWVVRVIRPDSAAG